MYLMKVVSAKLPKHRCVSVQSPFPFCGIGIPQYFQMVGCYKRSLSMKIVHFFSSESTLHFQVRLDYHFRAIDPPSDGRTCLPQWTYLFWLPIMKNQLFRRKTQSAARVEEYPESAQH